MQINWYWLLIGLIPYSIKRQKTKDKQIVRIRATFWHLTICWQQKDSVHGKPHFPRLSTGGHVTTIEIACSLCSLEGEKCSLLLSVNKL